MVVEFSDRCSGWTHRKNCTADFMSQRTLRCCLISVVKWRWPKEIGNFDFLFTSFHPTIFFFVHSFAFVCSLISFNYAILNSPIKPRVPVAPIFTKNGNPHSIQPCLIIQLINMPCRKPDYKIFWDDGLHAYKMSRPAKSRVGTSRSSWDNWPFAYVYSCRQVSCNAWVLLSIQDKKGYTALHHAAMGCVQCGFRYFKKH